MRYRKGWDRPGGWLAVLVWVVVIGCTATPREPAIVAPARIPEPVDAPVAATAPAPADAVTTDVPSSLTVPDASQVLSSPEVFVQVPDPIEVDQVLARQQAQELALIDQRPLSPEERRQERRSLLNDFQRRRKGTLEKLKPLRRKNRVELTLQEAIHKALRYNYYLESQAFNPAIEATRIVEAEAQFDALFFTNFTSDKQDQPTASQLQSAESNVRTWESGVRKLLSTGAQVSASYALTRNDTSLIFITLNPSYTNNFTVEFRQPFLRGFGLDYNRSQIELRKLSRQIQLERLRKEIRETIFNVEQAYWQLYQARRRAVVEAQLLTNLETILEWLTRRKEAGYDVYGVQLNLTRSRIEQEQAVLIQRITDVKNAEDQLKALMNDPELNLATDQELIPVDTPLLEPLAVDQIGEVASALAHRAELHEARDLIEQARLTIGIAKNQALPKLDALFRYIVTGLGGNWDTAWDQLTENDFHRYVIGVEFEWPIGNRGPEAAVRRARLQQAQAIANHRAQIENIIREVKQAIRDLQASYAQIAPALRAARASEDQLRATKARQERLDPPSLQVELDAHQALATARNGLLQVLTNYNVALVNLERAKGTLLEYNNIVIRGADDLYRQQPYRASAE